MAVSFRELVSMRHFTASWCNTEVGYACPLYVRRGVVSEGSEVVLGICGVAGEVWAFRNN